MALYTRVNKFTLSVQVIKRLEEVLQAAFKKRVGEPPCWISLEYILPAIPHRSLDKALVITSRPVDGE